VLKDFGSRLQVIGLLPTILAVGVVTFLVAADAPSNSLSWSTIQEAVTSIGGVGLIVISGVSVAVAISLQPLQFRLVQLLEGYWPAWFPQWMARLGVRLEMNRRDRIKRRLRPGKLRKTVAAEVTALERAQAAESQIRERFPADDRMLPTALGNALRAAEDTVGQRYDLESVVIWPRLFQVLPERIRTAIDDEVTQLDVSARLTVTWTLAGMVCLLWLLRDVAALLENPLWLAVVASVFLLARLSYQSAVESAIAHGVDLEVAIDLYRARVIDAMRLYPTVSLKQERRVFRELSGLFRESSPSDRNLHFVATARAGASSD